MAKKLPELSIFFPFWNEEENVSRVVFSALDVAKKVTVKWEIIIIDDGSSDNTLREAEKIAFENKNIRIVSHKPNRGYGAALKEGFQNASYNYIVFTDGDGQFDIAQITKFIDKIDNADIVIGYRRKRRDTFARHILMYMLRVWDLIFFGFWFRDIDCGFKMFKKESLDKIMPLRSEGAMITTEILAKAKRKNLKIEQVEVDHYKRQFGEQSGANLAVIVRAVLESMILWWDIRNKRI
ncbi:MAG: hypothetical protein A3G66_01365 [Candidatus Levybacteria bacterium RIFCSPLOWO2_12_FULL_39_17]|nr:MAG: Glycosyltransferase [Candidatus Levybacteria bacterium GW2011_GWA1_39_11]OGD89854.1 MAG: hypothetical protein A2Z54_03190 [Candidatus Curtissbacteria bacterium RIFCSPHIGHO2_02_39_8]OGH15338.1 MAG: hypothetical protein A2689_02240 [Candidatus Levybacteria bacterium RIFCSPHIGHO2_01_FULL_38_96]OGH36370.1 MAG: hypothetical protein A3B43_02920 [Candidatus Levybacteria bacterium RIFCSPLOWO2_01_FULL_38_120]OGH47102.1 MAG: hypothetical protein A3G66_01365 [Candidatus Levybacteria bacterium RIFC